MEVRKYGSFEGCIKREKSYEFNPEFFLFMAPLLLWKHILDLQTFVVLDLQSFVVNKLPKDGTLVQKHVGVGT